MKDWAAIRQRYLRDDLTVRLGGPAANLPHQIVCQPRREPRSRREHDRIDAIQKAQTLGVLKPIE